MFSDNDLKQIHDKLSAESNTFTIIDNATFNETVAGADIDSSAYKNGIILIKTGTVTDSPTLTVKLQVKDSNGNYYDYSSVTAVNTATSTFKDIANIYGSTVRVVCTYGGTGSFANTTVELQVKK